MCFLLAPAGVYLSYGYHQAIKNTEQKVPGQVPPKHEAQFLDAALTKPAGE